MISKSKWQVGKWYYLKNRQKFKILETDSPSTGFIIAVSDIGNVLEFLQSGVSVFSKSVILTTEEVKEPEHIWLNVYNNMDDHWIIPYPKREDADTSLNIKSRIARIEINIDEIRGRFDELD